MSQDFLLSIRFAFISGQKDGRDSFLDPTNSKYLLDRLSECNRHVVSVLKCVESRIQNECDVDGWCD